MEFIKPNWPAPNHIKAYTTLRHSWGDPASAPKSAASTAHLETLLQLPNHPHWISQTHSNIVVDVANATLGQNADASFSNQPHLVCTILTADCLPILISNRQGTKVAAIHAGWRGLANGILENTLTALQLSPDDVLVWLGPAIGPQKFEVGNDVFEAFVNKQPETHSGFVSHHTNKWLANLYELARVKLNLQGITHIYGGDYCTYTQQDLFYSYRRDHGKTGRMASVIWIDS